MPGNKPVTQPNQKPIDHASGLVKLAQNFMVMVKVKNYENGVSS